WSARVPGGRWAAASRPGRCGRPNWSTSTAPALAGGRRRPLVGDPGAEQAQVVGHELLVLMGWEGAADGLHQVGVELGAGDVFGHALLGMGQVPVAELSEAVGLVVVVDQPPVGGQLVLPGRR